jgi:arabinose-5-phosphate isomerase
VTAPANGGRLDVVGIGSMVVDRFHRAPRILGPDEKCILVPLPGGPATRFVGGVVLNHLGWGAVLGLRTGIFGRQPDDEDGRFLRAAMDRHGIERHLLPAGSASSLAEVFVDAAGSRAIYMAPGATRETPPEEIRRHHSVFIRRAARLTTEVSQLPLAAALEAVAVAREAGIPAWVDLDVPPSDAVPGLGEEAELVALLRAAELLKPSKAAARELVPDASDALMLARGIRARFGNRAVIVTDAEAGCAIAAADFEGWVPARPVKAVDETGAGDAFLGGLLAAFHHRLGWADAGRLANACGAACVERLGAFPEDGAAARARVLELYDGPPVAFAPLPAPPPPSPHAREALAVLEVAAEEIARLRSRLHPLGIDRAAALVREAEAQGGRVHVTGVGKSGHVARYGAALLASTGTPANFYDANESVHGSSGQIVPGDVVIAISASGETEELHLAVAVARRLGARVIAVTGGLESTLARGADVLLDAGVAREGGPLGLAPRASVAAQVLVVGALAAALEHARGFTRTDFHARHPAGSLGRRTRADDPEG